MPDTENKLTNKIGPDMHLGCGGKAPDYSGIGTKKCADCGQTVEVPANVFICPLCEGPLGD